MITDNKTKSEATHPIPESDTQVYNPITGHYVKRNSLSGKLVDVKSDGRAFKGVIKEENITNVGVNISRTVANKAEQSVITTLNSFAKPLQAEKKERDSEKMSLRNLLEQITPEYRDIIDLSYFKGLTQEEISQLQGIPLVTVKTRLRAALSQLRQLVA